MTGKRAFNEGLNRVTRQLHLYGGLFLCPFLLIFAISTIRLNHGWQRPPDETTTTVALPIPIDLLADAIAAMSACTSHAAGTARLSSRCLTLLYTHWRNFVDSNQAT